MEGKREVVILSAVRTPLGSFGGSLASVPAPRLGATAIREALKRANISGDEVDEVFMGNVLSAGVGQAPARQAALFGGISQETPCTTVNKVCASGMKAIIIGSQTIRLGENRIVVAGGMESMSNVPHYLKGYRWGSKLGHGTLIDGLIHDGLWDVYNDMHMGSCTEVCIREVGFSREEQDDYAEESYRRAEQAWKEGWFREEVVPVEVETRKGKVLVDEDEEYKRVDFEKLRKLPPVFEKGGTITAGNASTINDGAAALVLASGEEAERRGLRPVARIVGWADAATDPVHFSLAPALAVQKLLDRTGWKKEDVEYWEINEAFAGVVLLNMKELGITHERVNLYGGAVSLGHPIGCSGARIVVTLLSVLRNNGWKRGVAAICNGGGGASALAVELL